MIGYFRLPQTETLPDRIAHRLILRVIADSGITYDEPSLKTALNDLNNDGVLSSAILVMTPNSSKVSKLYSALPTSGVGDFTVSRNSTVWANNENGILTETPANVPCFEWENGKPHLLTQPQSTNLLTYSNDFSNASWFKINGSSIILNSIISPDGTLNASKLTFTTTNSSRIEKQINTIIGFDYTFSIYLKTLNGNKNIRLGFSSSNPIFYKDIVVSENWEKFDFTFKNYSGTNIYPQISNAVDSLDGDIYIYGAQLEQLSYPTSYIPTVGTTVTRLADVVTGAGDVNTFSSINSEGCLFVETAALADDGTNRRISISDGTNNNRIVISFDSANKAQTLLVINNVAIAAQSKIIDINNNIKFAFTWSSSVSKLFVNGVIVESDVTTKTFNANTLISLQLADGAVGSPFYGKTKQIAVLPYLTDEQCIALTT